jgi:predicted RNA-binding Zn ribbon-like protein
MAVEWTAHRFSGGVLALDTANTVVHRGNAALGFDRFEDVGEIFRFAEAATVFRAGELGGRRLVALAPAKVAPKVLAMREATDRLFRDAALTGGRDTAALGDFLSACAAGLAGHRMQVGQPGKPFGEVASPLAFEAALALSALSLLPETQSRRIRICGNCGWLFLDASRNASRVWCDMAVCGNRQKAKRHYRRQRVAFGEGARGHD